MKTTPNARPALLLGTILAAAAVFGLSERSEDMAQFLDRKARSDAQAEQGKYTREEILLLQQEARERIEQFHRLPGHLLAAVSKGELSRADAVRLAREQPDARVPQQPQTGATKTAKARFVRLALVAALVIVLALFHLSRSRKTV
ncbi:MAG: hypothetical protein J5985_03695 [Kiritimatiellae bacterium]|nr:hypothetical protein [Kiritimatiellia bacterium]